MPNSRKKILYFVSRIPFPLEKGDKLRAYHQIKQLSKNNDIYLAVVASKQLNQSAAKELSKYIKEIYHYRLSKFSLLNGLMIATMSKYPFQVGYFFNSGAHLFFQKVIEELQPDHIVAQLVRTTEYVRKIKDIPKSLDYMDAFSAGMFRRAKQSSGIKAMIFKKEAEKLSHYEAQIHKDFNHSFIISEQDAKAVGHGSVESIKVLPNGVDDEFFSPSGTEKQYDLVFTGNMAYPPNIDAAVFLGEQVIPLLLNKNPNIKLLIAGATPVAQVKALANKNITVSGWMDDIRDAYNEGKIFIAPLRIGSGLQNKLLEAMCMELPCISSALANNALKAALNEDIIIAETAEEYAKKVIELLENDGLRQKLSVNGRRFVISNYNWETINKVMEQEILNH